MFRCGICNTALGFVPSLLKKHSHFTHYPILMLNELLVIVIDYKDSPLQIVKNSRKIKEIVERRHGEPIKFLPKMGLLGSQAGNEKDCWL
jgi:hypothetical protein